MNLKRIGGIGAFVLAAAVVALAVSPLGGAAVRHVSQLIAPTSKSAVADINAFNNWGLNDCGSTCSRAGFKSVTHFDTGIYCLTSPTAKPDGSMLEVTGDAEHSNAVPQAIMWDRSSPNCGSSSYEVYTYCAGEIVPPPPGQPTPKAPEGLLCDDVAFYAEAYVR
jgi:hypothetical protein